MKKKFFLSLGVVAALTVFLAITGLADGQGVSMNLGEAFDITAPGGVEIEATVSGLNAGFNEVAGGTVNFNANAGYEITAQITDSSGLSDHSLVATDFYIKGGTQGSYVNFSASAITLATSATLPGGGAGTVDDVYFKVSMDWADDLAVNGSEESVTVTYTITADS